MMFNDFCHANRDTSCIHVIYLSGNRWLMADQLHQILSMVTAREYKIDSREQLIQLINHREFFDVERIIIWTSEILHSDRPLISIIGALGKMVDIVEIIFNGPSELDNAAKIYDCICSNLEKAQHMRIMFAGWFIISQDFKEILLGQGYKYMNIHLPLVEMTRQIPIQSNIGVVFAGELGSLYTYNATLVNQSLEMRSKYDATNVVVWAKYLADMFFLRRSEHLNKDCWGIASSYLSDHALKRDVIYSFISDYLRYRLAKCITGSSRCTLVGNDFKQLGFNALESDYSSSSICGQFFIDPGSHSFPTRFYQRPVESLYKSAIPLPIFLYPNQVHPYSKFVFLLRDGREYDFLGLTRSMNSLELIEHALDISNISWAVQVTLRPPLLNSYS